MIKDEGIWGTKDLTDKGGQKNSFKRTFAKKAPSQLEFTYSKSKMETPEKYVKHNQC